MAKLAKIVSSFFYVGHSPLTPGTFGSLAGLGIYFLVKNNLILYGFCIAFLFSLGIVFTTEAERIYKRKDARMIVIDEVSGMLLALFLVPYSLQISIIGFLLFRFFDIIKPFPARRIEKISGAFGIMFDDIIAALYTNIILQILIRVLLGVS
jgi:phosphatidylglycerophosphatase A